MRFVIIALMLIFALQARADSDVSGILACNPNKTGAKPVIYAFDGKYLLRDNQKRTPFQHIASIAGFLEVYFAFVPSRKMYQRLNDIEQYRQDLKEAQDNIQKKVDGPNGQKYVEAFAEFQDWCQYYNSNPSVWLYGRHLGGTKATKYENYFLRNFVELNVGVAQPLNCENTKGKKLTDFIKSSEDLRKDYLDFSFSEFETNAFDQIKLTVDLSKMAVRQEVYKPRWESENRTAAFSGLEFQCQSLGIDVPEIDVSESITPIGRGF